MMVRRNFTSTEHFSSQHNEITIISKLNICYKIFPNVANEITEKQNYNKCEEMRFDVVFLLSTTAAYNHRTEWQQLKWSLWQEHEIWNSTQNSMRDLVIVYAHGLFCVCVGRHGKWYGTTAKRLRLAFWFIVCMYLPSLSLSLDFFSI